MQLVLTRADLTKYVQVRCWFFEKCRADGVALFLSADPHVLSVFGIDKRSDVAADVAADDGTTRYSTPATDLLLTLAVINLCILVALLVWRPEGIVYMGPKKKASLINLHCAKY
jgi:Peptidase family M49